MGEIAAPAIFISYRRDDTSSATGRLADALVARFGAENIFRDIQTIDPGDDFRRTLKQALAGTQVMLVVIGRSWAAGRSSSPPRLQNAGDYVRSEVEIALAQQLLIIPVLVEGASMPEPSTLPESMRALAFHQALELSDAHWSYDVDRLAAVLERHGIAAANQQRSRVSTAQIVTRARIVVTTLVDDFLRLLYEPRQLLTARATGTSRDVAHALVFLCVSQLLGGWLVLQEWPTRSGTVDFLTTGPVFVLLAALLVSIPMYAAWRISGAPREYQRVLVILLYQGSFVGMALSLVVFSMLVGIKLVVPEAVDRIAQTPNFSEVAKMLAALREAPAKGPWIVAALLQFVIEVGTVIWLARTWQAYGIVLGRTGLSSLLALLLFAIFVAIPVGVMVWAAMLV